MLEREQSDNFTGMAIIGERDFELLGKTLPPIPIGLKSYPDAAFILMTFLQEIEPFTARSVVKAPGFNESCGGQPSLARFYKSLEYLKFFYNAVGSTFIRVDGRDGFAHHFSRNPDYDVIDRR